MNPEAPRIWVESSARPEYEALMDASLLEKISVRELKDRIDRINMQYGYKLGKAATKPKLVQTLLSSYRLIAAIMSTDVVEEKVAPEDARNTIPSMDGILSEVNSSVIEPDQQRKKVKADKQGLITKIVLYNKSIDDGNLKDKTKITGYLSASYSKLIDKVNAACASHIL